MHDARRRARARGTMVPGTLRGFHLDRRFLSYDLEGRWTPPGCPRIRPSSDVHAASLEFASEVRDPRPDRHDTHAINAAGEHWWRRIARVCRTVPSTTYGFFPNFRQYADSDRTGYNKSVFLRPEGEFVGA